MEYLNLTMRENGLQVEGIADAKVIVKYSGPESKRLSDLNLHKNDLIFSKLCLENLSSTPEDLLVIRKSLWFSSIIFFNKCFGSGARFQLSEKKIYKKENELVWVVFDYFKNLRNKHVVHDENSYAQCINGIVLNDGSKDYKIEKIVSLSLTAATITPDNCRNLYNLVVKALAWVELEMDSICVKQTKELEKLSYNDLMKFGELSYTVPDISEIKESRK